MLAIHLLLYSPFRKMAISFSAFFILRRFCDFLSVNCGILSLFRNFLYFIMLRFVKINVRLHRKNRLGTFQTDFLRLRLVVALRACGANDTVTHVDEVVGNAFQAHHERGIVGTMFDVASALCKPCKVVGGECFLHIVHLIFQRGQVF